MNVVPSDEITAMLRQWREGTRLDADLLFEQVYPRLRSIAGALFQRERQDNLLQPTGVVNELFLKLVRQHTLHFEDRQHFYSFCARLMRRILVDYARNSQRQKRSGGVAVPLADDIAAIHTDLASLVHMDRVLLQLEQLDARKCQMIELRYLMGFTIEETSELMQLSKATVDRDLRFARLWLQERLRAGN